MPHATAASGRSETEEPMGETFSLASAGPVVEEWVQESVNVEVANVAERDGSGEEIPVELRLPTFPVPWRHPIRATIWTVRSLFGLVSLLLLLAIVAAIPIVNFVALGYLLEVEGRVGRSGRMRDAFPLMALAPRFGSIMLGVWLWLIPLRLLAGAASDARLIDPGSSSDMTLHLVLNVMWVLVTVHLCLALARGGSLSCFFRPIKNARWLWQRLKAGDYLDMASRHVRSFVSGLQLKHHFWLGLRGFIGGLAWLLIPTAIFAVNDDADGPQVGAAMIGGFLLAMTLSWMPFLQARFATEQRLRSMFHLRTIRRLFKHAPLAWLLAIAVVYVLALPLYLLKVALLPQDAYWLITLIFIASIYPAKVVAGWAYHRAVQREAAGELSWWVWRWLARLGMVPLLGAFAFLLYFTQFIGAHGSAGLFEHHAFLLPWPGQPG
ncbi:MAG: DUF4013 domain-containing protein [Planctomycetaceae bacterium]|nr:DUF4013 domain-containing protein [Planctomycetaceae bacterium]